MPSLFDYYFYIIISSLTSFIIFLFLSFLQKGICLADCVKPRKILHHAFLVPRLFTWVSKEGAHL